MPQTTHKTQADTPRWSLWVIVGAALAVWLWVTVPMAVGERTFYYRDVTENHLPVKAFGAEMLRQGKIPAFNPRWGLGQPFRGNPGALAFYPDNLLYLALPFWSAFNLHYCLHWLLAGLAMALLARRLGQSPPAALMAGLVYFGSGWMLTNLSFYNLITVAAWWPAVMAFAVGAGRRSTALAGLCCGMALLGGGPILAALGLVPLLMVAVTAHGRWRGLLRVGAIGGAGMLIALPQVVATARVVAFSVRAASRPQAAEVLTFVFHPLRSLELVIPFPFGWPAHALPYGLWGGDWLGGVPYYLSVYQGLVALWLAAIATCAARRHLRWALLALAGLLVAAFSGAAGELLVRLAGGLFRYPEKFLFWFALAMPLLAGWGLQHVLEERPLLRGGAGRLALWAGAALAGSGALLLALRGRAVARIDALNPTAPQPGTILAVQAMLWGASLLLGGTLLALAATAGRSGGRRAALGVLACQALCLLQLAPIVLVDSTARFKVTGDWPTGTARDAQWMGGVSLPRWTAMNGYWADVVPWRPMHLAPHATLAPAVGVFHDHGYPLATNAEGLGSVLKYELQKALQLAGWPERVNWLRVLGIERAAFGAPAEPTPGLRLVATIAHGEDRYYHYAVDDPAPEVRWPRHLIPVRDLDLAMLAVGKSPDPLATAALPAALGELDHDPTGRVRLITSEPDRLLFEVDSGGGVAVVRRAFHPLLHARIEGGALDGRTLPLFYADVFLTGIQVPPGHHHVALAAAGAGPEIAAGLLALAVAAGCGWVARPRRWGQNRSRA